MKFQNLWVICMALMFVFSSCGDDDDDITQPQTQAPVTDPPTSTNYFYGVQNNGTDQTKYATWTEDFQTFRTITTKYGGVVDVSIEGDHIAIGYRNTSNLYFVAYGLLSDLDNMKVAESSEFISDVVITDEGNVIVLSIVGNNYSVGGQNADGDQIVYNLLPAGQTLNELFNVGNAAAGSINNSQSSPNLFSARSGDSLKINALPPDLGGIGRIGRENGEFYASFFNNWARSSDPDIHTATWTKGESEDSYINTTSTVGSFSSNQHIIVLPNELRLYGIIDDANENYYPCVNISKDNGNTWETTLLDALQPLGQEFVNTADFCLPNLTLLRVTSFLTGVAENEYYTSTDGINFTRITDETQIQNLENFNNVKLHR